MLFCWFRLRTTAGHRGIIIIILIIIFIYTTNSTTWRPAQDPSVWSRAYESSHTWRCDRAAGCREIKPESTDSTTDRKSTFTVSLTGGSDIITNMSPSFHLSHTELNRFLLNTRQLCDFNSCRRCEDSCLFIVCLEAVKTELSHKNTRTTPTVTNDPTVKIKE